MGRPVIIGIVPLTAEQKYIVRSIARKEGRVAARKLIFRWWNTSGSDSAIKDRANKAIDVAEMEG